MKNIRQMIDEECENLKLLLKSKNTSYGDSFFKTLEKYGSSAICIRMFGDTLLDLAGYAILTKIYLDT